MRIHLLNNDRHSGKYGPAWKFIHLLLVKWKQNCFVLVKFLQRASIKLIYALQVLPQCRILH